MAAEEKKGFFASKAFILILVWIGLGVVLTVVMSTATPKMQSACEKWVEMADLGHGGGHDAGHGDASGAHDMEQGAGHGDVHTEHGAAPGHGGDHSATQKHVIAPPTGETEIQTEASGGGGGHHDPCHTVAVLKVNLRDARGKAAKAEGHEKQALEQQIATLEHAVSKLGGFKINLAEAFYTMYGGAEEKLKWATAWSIPNFLILVTFLVHFAGGALNDNFKQRREDLAKAIEEADRALKEAEAMKAEYEGKLESLGKEIDSINSELRAEGEAEKQKIIEEARKLAERIGNEAELSAKQKLLVARHQLREDAARLAVEVAEKVIRETIGDEDRDRLLNEYLDKVTEQKQ